VAGQDGQNPSDGAPGGAARKRDGSKNPAVEGRVFVRDGLRSFRRTYSLSEVYWGGGIGLGLLGLVGWVGYRGAHPDPSLFDMSAALQSSGVGSMVLPAGPPPAAGTPSGSPGAEERGLLPANLGTADFREGKIGAYTPENLYVKIDGRAEFFTSFGVKGMHTITLESTGPDGASVEIELYDLGEARNALGAYQGERPPGLQSTVENGSTFHFDRNSGFLARGSSYARVIGSDESPRVVREVHRLVELFAKQLPVGERPWAFDLFVDQLKLDAGQVSYQPENAFAFGFARDVYKAELSAADSKEDLELFVSVKADAAQASAEAAKYEAGFREQGVPAGQTPSGVALFKDEFLASLSGATSKDRFVFGVHGAPSAERLNAALQQLKTGIEALPDVVRARALPSPERKPEGEGESAAGPASSDPGSGAGPGPGSDSQPKDPRTKAGLEGASHEY
jgi:hypothetical protein